MPFYEYKCLDCQNQFELMRSFSESDDDAVCIDCGSHHTARKMSTFFAHGESRSTASACATSTTGGCGSCRGGSCGSCRH